MVRAWPRRVQLKEIMLPGGHGTQEHQLTCQFLSENPRNFPVAATFCGKRSCQNSQKTKNKTTRSFTIIRTLTIIEM